MCSAACTAPSERADDNSPIAVYTVVAADPKNDAEEEAGDACVPADPAEATASAAEPTTTGTATAEAEAKTTGKANQIQVHSTVTAQLLGYTDTVFRSKINHQFTNIVSKMLSNLTHQCSFS